MLVVTELVFIDSEKVTETDVSQLVVLLLFAGLVDLRVGATDSVIISFSTVLSTIVIVVLLLHTVTLSSVELSIIELLHTIAPP